MFASSARLVSVLGAGVSLGLSHKERGPRIGNRERAGVSGMELDE